MLAVAAERFWATELASLGDHAKAQELADDAVARLRAVPDAPPHDLVRTLYTASWIALKRSDMDRMKRYASEALALASRPPIDDGLLYLALEMKGDAARRDHNFAVAADAYRQSLALSVKVNGADDQETATIGQMLGTALEQMGSYDEALVDLKRALDIDNRVFGESSSRALRLGEAVGFTEFEAGRIVEARGRYERVIPLAESHDPVNEELVLGAAPQFRRDADRSRRARPRREIADRRARFSQAACRQRSERGRRDAVGARRSRGAHGPARKRRDEPARSARDTDQRQAGRHGARRGAARPRAAAARRRRAARFELGREARDIAVKVDGERSHDTAIAHYFYGLALAAANRASDAEAEWRAALDCYSKLLPPDGLHLRSADVRLALGEMLAARIDQREDSLRLLDQGIALREQFFGAQDARAQKARALVTEIKAGHVPSKHETPTSNAGGRA